MKTVILIGCGAKKDTKKQKAKNLYTGQYFKFILKYAEALSKKLNAKIYILSAKYGLLDLEDTIAPYDMTLNNKSEKYKKQWSYKVIQQLKKIIGQKDRVIFLAGKNYTRYLKRYFTNYEEPLGHLAMGEKMAYIKTYLKKAEEE